MKIKSNGLRPCILTTVLNISELAPTRISTFSMSTPDAVMIFLAASALFGSFSMVISLPPGGSARMIRIDE